MVEPAPSSIATRALPAAAALSWLVAAAAACPSPPPCTSHEDCAGEEVCALARCEASLPCDDDEGCPAESRCRDGRCKKAAQDDVGDDAGPLDASSDAGAGLDSGLDPGLDGGSPLHDGGAGDGGPLDAGGLDGGGADGGGLDGGPRDGGAGPDGGLDPPPARTCFELRRLQPGAPTGVHALDPDGSGPAAARDVYCEMETAGGGWTLALKVDGASDALAWASPLWSDATLLNAADLDLQRGDAKLQPFVDAAFDQVMVAMAPLPDVAPSAHVVLDVRGPSLRQVFAAGYFVPSALGAAPWRALLPQSSLQQGCLQEGLNPQNRVQSDFGMRIGLWANQEDDCQSPDSYVGVASTRGCAEAGGTFTAGACALPGYDADQGALAAPAQAYVFVRARTFTRLAPPRASCLDHLLAGEDESGVYLVDPTGQGPFPVRCDMETAGGGWTGVVDFDAARDPCPGGLVPAAGLDAPRACGRPADQLTAQAAFTAPLPTYGEVMGRVLAYQHGSMDAFLPPNTVDGGVVERGVDDVYVDGLSLTVDEPRRHVFTWAVGREETAATTDAVCPCAGGRPPPSFVGVDLRCESGTKTTATTWLPGDPLFDGFSTGPEPACAAQGSGAPFVRALPQPTSSPLQLRVMATNDSAVEDVAIYRLELYVR